MQTLFIVVFTFVEGMPPKKRSSLAYYSIKKSKKKSPSNSLIEVLSI